jgi:Phage Mu protein F like protein
MTKSDYSPKVKRAIKKMLKRYEQGGVNLGQLRDMLPVDKEEAMKIVITETTRYSSQEKLREGHKLKKEWPDVRVVKKWYTCNDFHVCPECASLHGVEVEIDQPFVTPSGREIDAPPLCDKCRCYISTGTRINES